MKRMISLGVVILCLSSGMVNAQSGNTSGVTEAGSYALTLPESDRRYTLVIPDGYTGREPVPLVMSLHYGGRVTPFYGRGLLEQLIEPVLRDLGAIIVAPDNVTGGWANAEAEQHVLELLDHIEANYNIDSDKILLTGYSMGGMGTWYLAPRYPDRFTAALPMAGRPQADSTSLDWRTPTYVIHSTDDEVVAFEPTQAAVEALKARDAPIELAVVSGLTHFQIPQFRPHLKAALPWIRETWGD